MAVRELAFTFSLFRSFALFRPMPPLVVSGVPFRSKGVYGDFAHMIKDPANASTVFVFNDNVVDADDAVPHDGAGSAAIRTFSWKYADPSTSPRAIGIPTGWSVASGGFQLDGDALEPFAARAITLAFERLHIACTIHNVERVVFSCDKDDPSNRRLGCGIFELEAPLLRYIEDKLHNLPTRVAEGPSKFTLERLGELEKQVAHVGRLQEKIARSVRRESPDDPKRRLVVRSTRMADESSNGVRYVGTMQDGSHVYEKLSGDGGAVSLKRARFFHQGPLLWK